MIESAYKIEFLEDRNKKLMEYIMELTAIIQKSESNFEQWWYLEGSGIAPTPGHDHEEHAHRISKIAWKEAEHSERHKNERDTIRNTNTKDLT